MVPSDIPEVKLSRFPVTDWWACLIKQQAVCMGVKNVFQHCITLHTPVTVALRALYADKQRFIT